MGRMWICLANESPSKVLGIEILDSLGLSPAFVAWVWHDRMDQLPAWTEEPRADQATRRLPVEFLIRHIILIDLVQQKY